MKLCGAENTNRENRRIASLVVWPFVGAQFLTFWDSNTLQWWWNWTKTCLLARKTYLHRKKTCPQACRVHGLPEIREILYFIAFIPLRSLLLRSGSHHISCFSARAEIPFRLHGIFSDFSVRLPGLNPSSCNRQFDFIRICFRSRAEISARLTRLKFAM